MKELLVPVLAHRIILSEEAKLSGQNPEHILAEIISRIPVPI
jgi:MoxR-like ATPase